MSYSENKLGNQQICLTVNSQLYCDFKRMYPNTLRQAVNVLLSKSVKDPSFLFNFLYSGE